MYQDYLAHHGVKGMKWGVRRYQNPDGSLTRAGKRKYSKNLYKKVLKSHDIYRNKNIDDPLIKQIYNDKRYQEAEKRLNAVDPDPYDDYNPFNDPKLIEQGKKNFEKDMGRKFDPENYQDEKALDYYIDDLYSYTYKPTEWDKAYDNFIKTEKKIIKDYVGSYGNKTIDRLTNRNYIDIVSSMLSNYSTQQFLVKSNKG